MSSLQVDNIQTYNSNPPVIKNVNGTEVGTFCRAWVNFNASSGTPSIRASHNVSSITDHGVGKFTLNFTNALADTNYSVVGTTGNTGSTSYTSFCGTSMPSTSAYDNKSTSGVYIAVLAGNNSAFIDHFDINVAVFR